MQKNAMIYRELKELNSSLADLSSLNVFTVPDDYFDSLSPAIMLSLRNQNSINELNIPVLDMQVPVGYFEGLANQIIDKIKAGAIIQADEEKDSALLAPLSRHNVFTIPENYFDNLAENISAKLNKQPAKVITLKSRPSIFRYAIAAALSGLLGLSLFNVLDNKQNLKTPVLASVVVAQPDQVLKTANEIIKNDSFDKTMEAMADDEILSYLKNDGEDVNAALVASVTDENTLPNEDAYFTDEKALDNFLNEQQIVQPNNN